MTRRLYMNRFQCGHDGCNEIANYEASTRADQADQWRRYANGKWRCTRHQHPQSVLTLENRTIVSDLTADEVLHDGRPLDGLYWHGSTLKSGFTHGPGFKAFASDFPKGSVLRVTAEIVLPADGASSASTTGPDRAPGTNPKPPSPKAP